MFSLTARVGIEPLGLISVIRRKIALLGAVFIVWHLSGCAVEVKDHPFGKPDPIKAAEVSVNAGREYLKVGNLDRAYHHFSKALSFQPKSSQAHNAIALYYKITGDVELEESHFKKAIRYDGDSSTARNNYGAFLYRVGRYKEALKQLEKAAEDPAYENRSSAYVNMGLCALKLDDLEQAESSFKRSIRLDASLQRPALELADLYYGQNRIKEAERYIKQFGSIAKHTPRSLWLAIRIAQKTNDKNELASRVLALKNLYPNSEEYRLYRISIGE